MNKPQPGLLHCSKINSCVSINKQFFSFSCLYFFPSKLHLQLKMKTIEIKRLNSLIKITDRNDGSSYEINYMGPLPQRKNTEDISSFWAIGFISF